VRKVNSFKVSKFAFTKELQMSEDNKELINSQLPTHLIPYIDKGGPTGLEEMSEFLTPPRLKIAQANRKGEFKAFEEGTILITPTNEVACGPNGFFAFTVVYAYPQFCVHNPFKRPEGMPWIRESTLDADSELAQKCVQFVSETMPEDNDQKIRYATHFNFLIIIHGIPTFANIPVIMSLFIGEAKSGKRLNDLIKARVSGEYKGTKIYMHNIMAHQSLHRNPGNEWQGLDFSNPTADVDCGRFVPTAEFVEAYAKLHEQCKVDKERFVIKYDDDEVTSDTL